MTATNTIRNRDLTERIEARLRSGERPEELAARARLSVSTLYWVRRTGAMSRATAAKLTAALGVAEQKP